jgi:hypothetical protein
MKFHWQQILFICAHNGHSKNTTVCHLTICILLKRSRGKHVELTVAQGEPHKQHTALQNRKINFFHTDIYSGPDSSLCHKVYRKHNQANLFVKPGPYKHRYNKQATYHTVWLSRRFSYPNLWALGIHIIWTHYVPVLRRSSPRIWNYAYSDGETGTGGIFSTFTCRDRAPSYGASYNTTTKITWQL